jgi:hypothetical protein
VIFDVFAGEPGAPVFVPGVAQPRYALTVDPRTVRAGVKRTFGFHAAFGKDAVAGALVSFAGARARTGPRGNARIAASFGTRGTRRATLTVGGRVVARATVTVTPRSGGGGGGPGGDDDDDD